MMFNRKLSCTTRFFFILSVAILLTQPLFSQSSGGSRIVAYVMGSRGSDISSIKAEKLTHINYAFASIIDGEIAFRFRRPDQEERIKLNIKKLTDLRQINPDLKIMLSVGGWANCAGFSDAALNDGARQRFARSAVRIMKEYDFDGIDLDWEYPGQIGGGEVFRPEDKENFTLMIKALRDEFNRNDPKKLLTIATGADEEYFKWTELGEAQKYLDFINIMAYDFYSGLSTTSGHHANLQKSGSPGAIPISAEIAVDRHMKAGVPAGKLVIGVPFYGRYWRGVPDINHGMYQKANTVGQYKIYTELVNNYVNKNTFTRFWDETAKAPYLFSKDSAMVISYDDPESLTLKAEYIKANHLGGFMFWEYFGDNTGILLETIFKQTRNPMR